MVVGEGADGSLVEMIAVLVGDEDVVGLGHRGVVDDAVAHLTHGVDEYLPAVEDDAHAGVYEGVEAYHLSAGGEEDVGLVGIGDDWHIALPPSDDATLEVDDLESLCSKLLGSVGRSAPGAAIDGDGLGGWEEGFGLVGEGVVLYVEVDGIGEVPLGILVGGAHVEHYHVGFGNERGKLAGIGIVEVLLAAGGVKPQQSQKAGENLFHIVFFLFVQFSVFRFFSLFRYSRPRGA